jgi:hypothetical protein
MCFLETPKKIIPKSSLATFLMAVIRALSTETLAIVDFFLHNCEIEGRN